MEPMETGDALAEVDRRQAERDEQPVELDHRESRSGRRGWFRKSIVVALVVLAVLSFVAAVPGVWARRNLLDTDRFVSRVAPLVEEPEVQEALTFRLTTQLMLLIDPRELFDEALPERGQILAVPLANAVEGFVEDRVESFIASDRFAQLWEGAARIAHQSSVSLLRGRSGDVVAAEGGQVTLNLVPVVNALLREIGSVSPEILGREIDLPEVSVGDVPTTAIARIEDAFDVELSDDFGQITVYEDESLAAAQEGVKLFDRLVLVLLPLSVLFAGTALWLSRHRRRTLLQLAGGVAIGMVLIRRVVFAVEDDIAALPPTEPGREAAAAAADAFLDPLVTFAAWSLAVAGIVAVVALLTGKQAWAVSFRQRVRDLWRAIASTTSERARDGATVAWVTAHRDALMVGGVAVGLLLLWTTDLSWGGLLIVLGLVAAFEAMVYRIGAPVEPST